MRHVKVYPIRNFDSLQKEALSLIPTSTAKVFGDYKIDNQWRVYEINDRLLKSSDRLSTKPYLDVTMRMIRKACNAYTRSWRCTSWELKSLWYHVYNEGGTYEWHTNTSSTNMTGVIQLLLEDERDYTKIMGFEEKIKEGDITLFPSMHPHKSEVVHGSKIVIGFGWNMHSDMQKPEQASPWVISI